MRMLMLLKTTLLPQMVVVSDEFEIANSPSDSTMKDETTFLEGHFKDI